MKNLKIQMRRDEEVTILDLAGTLSIGEGDIDLKQKISDLIDQGSTQILLNLKEVSLMDSAGVGQLAESKRKAETRGVSIKLLHLQEKVSGPLVISNLIGEFIIFNDEIEAVASFRQPEATAPPATPTRKDSETVS